MKNKLKLTYTTGNIDETIAKYLHSQADRKAFSDYRKDFIAASNFEKRFDFPIHINIELNNICNYRCSFCSHGRDKTLKSDYYRSKVTLPKKAVFLLLEECAKIGVKSVQFNMVNEPLICPDLIEVIKYAKKLKFSDLYFITNAALLTKSLSRRLIKSGLTKIMFSLDAFSEEVYAEIRRKKNYYQSVVNNILDFVKIKKQLKYKLPAIRVSFVVTKDNRHQLNDFRRYWEKKVDFIAIQNLSSLDSLKHDESEKLKKLKNYRCNGPFFRLAIRANGNVNPCCSLYADDIVVGNIFTDSLYNIWNSNDLRVFQNMHKDFKWYTHVICRKCVLNTDFAYEEDIMEEKQ